jgi:molybdopterin converting factor small subunit
VVITVRLFGALADAAGVRWLSVTLHSGATVAELLRSVSEAYPPLLRFMPDPGHEVTDFLLVARGTDEVPLSTVLQAGDEILLALPMSGGAH